MVRALDSSPFSSGSGEVVTQVASNSLVVARGGVGNSPGTLRKKISSNRGRAFSEPSLHCFGVLGMRKSAQACLNAMAPANDLLPHFQLRPIPPSGYSPYR